MSDKTPNLIRYYFWGSGEPVCIAEFRLNTDGQVVLTVLDPAAEYVAREYYDHGLEWVSERRTVFPSDGPDFMRALLQPFRTTYYQFVDESEYPDDAS